ncbi:MAG: hypothetical protein ACK4MU_03850 [Thermomonas sp.]
MLAPGSIAPGERLARALRAGLQPDAFDADDIDRMKREGRA